MHIHVACDHAGYELKNAIVTHLRTTGHQVDDHGAMQYDPNDDYPSVCIAAAQAVAATPGSLGVVIGGSGNGEQIVANKVRGIRAALTWSPRTARLARQHNDANVMALGAREHTAAEALAIVKAFLSEPFGQDTRHQRRIDQVMAFEAEQ
ncbi:MAG: ribose-5-phosphate isomerase [Micrococcales bacterium]|nr:ribose-5-phosphate isomerase [Micrococcales bacterium]